MFRYLLPALTITATSRLCPNLKTSASNVSLRPPGWVFGVVWPVLYVLTGVSWHRTKLDAPYFLLVGSLCAWLVLYSCRGQKSRAKYVLFLSTLLSYYLSAKLYSTNGPYMFMFPLALWLTFASWLNHAEVTNLEKQRLD